MKTLIFINYAVAVVALILAIEICFRIIEEFERLYPNMKLRQVHPISKVFNLISLVVKCMIPLYNILLIISMLVFSERIVEEGIIYLRKRCEEV